MMSVMIGCIQISMMLTMLQAMHMDDGHTGHWNGLIPGKGPPTTTRKRSRASSTSGCCWCSSLSMKTLAHRFLRNNQEWAGLKKALKTEGPFARPTASVPVCAGAPPVRRDGGRIAQGDTMMREIVVLGIIAGVTLVTTCCLGDNYLLLFGRHYKRIAGTSPRDVAMVYAFVSPGVARAAALVVAVATAGQHTGVVVFLLGLSVTTLSVVLRCGPRPLWASRSAVRTPTATCAPSLRTTRTLRSASGS